jgi:hypothetical protein
MEGVKTWLSSKTAYLTHAYKNVFSDTNVPHVEAGYNTSDVALCRKRRRKREHSARGYNWATLLLGDINTGDWPSRLDKSRMRQCATLTSE